MTLSNQNMHMLLFFKSHLMRMCLLGILHMGPLILTPCSLAVVSIYIIICFRVDVALPVFKIIITNYNNYNIIENNSNHGRLLETVVAPLASPPDHQMRWLTLPLIDARPPD